MQVVLPQPGGPVSRTFLANSPGMAALPLPQQVGCDFAADLGSVAARSDNPTERVVPLRRSAPMGGGVDADSVRRRRPVRQPLRGPVPGPRLQLPGLDG